MKRKSLILSLIFSTAFFCSCGKLPPEEQKILQEEVNARKIQRVTDNQIVALVQEKVEQLAILTDTIDNLDKRKEAMQLWLGPEHQVDYLFPENADSRELKEILEAYMYSVAEGATVSGNQQRLENGNILYTLPHIKDSSGIQVLEGIWKIEFFKKSLINEISKDYSY